MAKTKKSTDPNVIAHEILQVLTGEPSGSTSVEKAGKDKVASISRNEKSSSKPKATPEKNPAAVALGRLGGLKGGKARMAKLSAKRRVEIAQKAARKRWDKD